MTLILKPLHPVFVAEATGLDLTKPISRADACEINAAMNRYGVLVWRSQPSGGDAELGWRYRVRRFARCIRYAGPPDAFDGCPS